ncbi:MAG TPA: Gfo/Idh/MocA family oxidoreductase [Lacunisphaera sp.]
MNKIRFGILGSGYMGRTHAEAVRRLPNAELVAVHGGTRAPALAERYGMTFEADKAALLQRRDIDAIVVTTPHHLHVDETLAALAQGKHVLVEKPLATSVADCDRMIAAATQRKLTLAVGYQQRFRVNNARACELIRAGAIGRVLAVTISMPMYAGAIKSGGFGGNWAWWNDPASVGHLINSAPHAIDLLRWFTGGDVVTVSAFTRTFLPDVPVEDTTMGLLEFSTGAICSLFSSRALPAPSFPGEDFRFRITGTTGLLDLDPYGELRQSDEKGWRVVCQQPPVKHDAADAAFGDVRMQAYCDQLSAFIAAIEGRPSDVGSAADGRAGVAACMAMLESSATRGWVYPGGRR